MAYPMLIQGGMGVGVSNWRLARTVSQEGQLGVVSGTIIDVVFARRLQEGDKGGHMRRACQAFPDQEIAERVWQRFYKEGGKAADEPYKNVPMIEINQSRQSQELLILANFAEVYLAKEGHDGLVGINFLEKIQLPHLPSIYGAMLAGVDYVLMGAGIPKAIPGILDKLSENADVSMKLDVQTDTTSNTDTKDQTYVHFSPSAILSQLKPLKRPQFLAIVSSHTLAANLAKKSSGQVNGFVIENHKAGGHNAPPRGAMTLNESGEPVYGPRDAADLNEMKKLGLPFWLAGTFGSEDKLKEALEAGAVGVQVGTPFAFSEESGIAEAVKLGVLEQVKDGTITVFTDPCASASGYPFKVASLENSLSEAEIYADRQRVCDLGYLRTAYTRENGSIGFRCTGEAACDFTRKGGKAEETENRKCLCNALLATIGLGQVRSNGYVEPPLVTAGDHISELAEYLQDGKLSYSAREVVARILGKPTIETTTKGLSDSETSSKPELLQPV